ncbi:MAG: hypothetical protein Q7R33_09830 [Nitrosarchaeum sp.]|nr:hypothetical protein [Nitrosarchaeum sp.]
MGNKNKKEVHYLPKQTTNCQINEIKPEHKKYFSPDSLDQAHREGFDNCAYCLGGSTR